MGLSDNKNITQKQCKLLWYILRESADCKQIEIYNTEKKGIYQLSVYEEEKEYLKDAGEMTMYDYNNDTKKIERMKQEEFIKKYCDGDSAFGRKVWEIFKIELAGYGKNGRGGGYIYHDEDIVYSYIKDNVGKHFIMFGINLSEVKAQKYVDEEIDEYVKLKMRDEEDYFGLSSETTTYIAMRKLPKMKKQEGIDLCKELVETCKKFSLELKGVKNIEKGLSLYEKYAETVDKWNNRLEELRKDWKKLTFGGTKIKKGYLMTAEEKQEEERLTKMIWEVEPLLNRDKEYSKYHEFISMIKNRLDRAKNSMLLKEKITEIEVSGDFIPAMISANGKKIM